MKINISQLVVFFGLLIQIFGSNKVFAQNDEKLFIDHPVYKFLSENKTNLNHIQLLGGFKDSVTQIMTQINDWADYKKISKEDYDSLKFYYEQIRTELDSVNTKQLNAMNSIITAKTIKAAKKGIENWYSNFESVASVNTKKAKAIHDNKFKPYFDKVNASLGAKFIGVTIAGVGTFLLQTFQFVQKHWPEVKEALNTFFPKFKPIDKFQQETIGKAFELYYKKNIATYLTLPEWDSMVKPYKPVTLENSTVDITDSNIEGFEEIIPPKTDSKRTSEHVTADATTNKIFNYCKNSKNSKMNDINQNNAFYRWEIKNNDKEQQGLMVYKKGWKFETLSDTTLSNFELKTQLFLGASSNFKNAKMLLWNINKNYSPDHNYLPDFTANYIYLNNQDSAIIGILEFAPYSQNNTNRVFKNKYKPLRVKLPEGINANQLVNLRVLQVGKNCNIFIDGKLLMQINDRHINPVPVSQFSCGYVNLSSMKTTDAEFQSNYQAWPIVVKKLSISNWSNHNSATNYLDAAGSKSVTSKRKLHYLVVGISQYDNNTYNLKYADKDAKVVAAMFKQMAPKAEPNDVVMLYNRDATKENIMSNIETILKGCNPEDFFYFYFSGHGVVDGLVPSNFNGKSSTILKYSDIMKVFNKYNVELKMMLLDACHSGSAQAAILKDSKFIDGQEFDNFTNAIAEYSGENAIGAIASSTRQEKSWEEPKIGHSLYTYWLVRGCYYGKADTNKDQLISIDEIQEYLRANVDKMQNAQTITKKINGKLPIAIYSKK